MGNHKELIVWQKSITLVKLVYQQTGSFPSDERFGLTNQMRRCSVSIPSNIAEGFGRGSDKELTQFLRISLGSLSELDTQLILSKELHYMDEKRYNELSALNEEVAKMLSSLIYRRVNGLDSNLKTNKLTNL
ncbi:MAG: four helix bundle protein [Parabacteroides merdae]